MSNLQLGGRAVAGYLHLDEAVGVALGNIDLGVLAGIFEALVPAQI